MKRFLYVCSTSYTIYNCINAVLSDFEGSKGFSDLVVFARTKDLIRIVDKIREEKIFQNVYCYEFLNNMSLEKKIVTLLFPKYSLKKLKIGKSRKNDNFHFDVIVSQSNLYALIFKRINKKAEYYLIEDGLSSYTNRTSNPNQRDKFFRIAYTLFGLKKSDYQGQLLYNKNMYMDFDNSNVISMNCPNDYTIGILKRVFGNKSNPIYQKYSYIYLGTPLFGIRKLLVDQKVDSNFELKARKVLVESLLLVDGFVYRRHPIENNDLHELKGKMEIDEENNMWELEAFNSVSDNSILISFFSTASLTPKLLYDKEPFIIYLYKLLDYEFYNAERVISKIRDCYRDREKIIVPENKNELKVMLNRLKNMQENLQ